MKILSLGHSAYLLEMSPASGPPVRILVDPWLSDYVLGDLLGRFPRLRFEARALDPVHAVFLSHSHTDHCDPYTLVRLWRELSTRPVLFLPQSLRYLEGLLAEHLAGARIVFLEDQKPQGFLGLQVQAFFNPEPRPTNEDDVMVLVVEGDREVFLGESDAVLPLYDPEARSRIAELLLTPRFETAVFHTTRNEGEATMAAASARCVRDRERRVGRSLERTYEEVQGLYEPLEDLEVDLWQDERLVRLVGGQGISFPQKLGTAWNRVLFPIRIEDRVRIEREVAKQCGCRHAVEAFVPGCAHVVEGGRLQGREHSGAIELLDREDERRYDPKLPQPEPFATAPLRDEARDADAQRCRLLDCLNQRFLPHLIGARSPPVEHLLAAAGGEYRIRVRFGTTERPLDRDFRAGFERLRFEEAEAEGTAQEFYWANDLEDFLDGRCDEFSTFCRSPLGAEAQRLWLCLGLPYLNNDLVERKLRLHCERASRGEPLEDWVLALHRPLAGRSGSA
jgi:L-ascorbate metabolism protein UlaG (beta-lactamase superfamily)